jgi:MFS family permease
MSSEINENSLKRSVLLVATFAAFLTPFMGSAVNLALPTIGREFNADAIELGWVISSFILSSAIFLLPLGRLADIIGRKRVFSYGILLFTVSTFAIIFHGTSKYLYSLERFRVFQAP